MSRSHKSRLLLRLKNLSICRGDKTIIKDLNLEILRGQHWVVFGPNGSGKTSLLSSLTGYMPPSEGEISVFNDRYGETDWRELRKKIGIVSSSLRQLMENSEPAIDSVVSGKYAMIDYWGTPSRVDKARARKLLTLVECGELENRPWLYLSQGERQRVLIARALMAKPALLILDESCAGLDPLAREKFLLFLRRLLKTRQAPALIFVTHHVEEIIPEMTHCLLLKDGRNLHSGPIKETLTSTRLTELFSSPARLTRKNGQYSLRIQPTRSAWSGS